MERLGQATSLNQDNRSKKSLKCWEFKWVGKESSEARDFI